MLQKQELMNNTQRFLAGKPANNALLWGARGTGKSSLIKAVIKAESSFDHKAVSKKGAKGLMQLMPKTVNDMEVADPYNPEENIFGGAKYLSSLMERFKNNIEHALAAYNAGPEKVEQYNGIPPYSETKEFVKRVLSYLKEYESTKQ